MAVNPSKLEKEDLALNRSDKPWQEERNPAVPQQKIARKRHPLSLPPGSVRALLTVLIVAVVAFQLARNQSPGMLWSETLMIVLAHYFTSRRLVELPKEALDLLQQQGYWQPEAQPLYLPRNSIRTIIIAVFVGLAWYLYQNDTLFKNLEVWKFLVLVFAYLFGVIASGFGRILSPRQDTAAYAIWNDLKALVVIGMVGFNALCFVAGRQDLVPETLQHATMIVTLFYFGSR